MAKQDISNREDVEKLVHTFYGQVRQHPHLGPIFNGIVTNWPEHLERLSDFWEMILLQSGPGKQKFNPLKAHKEVDQKTGQGLTQVHFGNWLELWFTTLDMLFEGKVADHAKEHARNMASILFLRIYEARDR
ncbi:group III truncated hemoglobin [Echinicola vietnamensis]|uniref:Hemoglobin n=1 Tax=Echinicola vietnamensis (strain DSM 17526 / LMG 23754 / KMM 6221) TaxID=926556 RepID=L0G435_ECHVK|nr:group III truncated hemoglobin [Echinicola vietnamensis]AGA79776.1 hypothetical protein Echvi_3560 [Echinicola vietnamensis DSM 17526]